MPVATIIASFHNAPFANFLGQKENARADERFRTPGALGCDIRHSEFADLPAMCTHARAIWKRRAECEYLQCCETPHYRIRPLKHWSREHAIMAACDAKIANCEHSWNALKNLSRTNGGRTTSATDWTRRESSSVQPTYRWRLS
jgi:hypothetical protein